MNQFIGWFESNMGITPDIQAKLINTLLVILVILLVYQVLLRGVIQRISDLRVRYRWKRALSYTFYTIAVLFVGPIWFDCLRQMATFLGLLTAGLAIAMKDPITDVIGWGFILLRRPLDIGDRVQVGNYAGDVIDLGLFQFTLMEIGNWVDAEQSTGRMLHLPNAMVFTSVLANYTKGFNYIWNEVPVLLSFDSNWEKARELLEGLADQNVQGTESNIEEGLRQSSNRYMIQYGKITPMVYVTVKEQGILLTVRYLIEPRARRDSTHNLWVNILRAFAQHPDIRFAGQPVLAKDLAEV